MTNRIHPTAIIGAQVELGDNNVIGPYTVIVGPARIGDNNWIGPHVSIGTPAEVRGGPHPVGWEGEADGAESEMSDLRPATRDSAPSAEGPGVFIGNRNTVREFVTINQGWADHTFVGDDCYVLARSHIGHDCHLRNSVTLADAVQLGGHTYVWSWANIGMGTVVHQRSLVGPGAMIGMGSAVRKDVPAFTITVGNPARVTGVNSVGLSRRGCSEEVIEAFGQHLAGKAEVPDNLPPELADELKAWFQQLADGKM